MAGDEDEPEARFHDPMPPGYVFVPKGDVYITKNCRKETHSAGQTVYVVVNKRRKPIGLRCPVSIVKAVQESEQATAAKRAEAVQKRDAAMEGGFEEALKRLYPNTPKESIQKIVSHALKKRSRRVGRSGTVQLDDKVKLAVRAHIRHEHTEYEQLLRKGKTREGARRKVYSKLKEVARLWGGRPAKSAGTKRKAEDDGDEVRITREGSKMRKRQKKEEGIKTAATGAKTARLKRGMIERKKARKRMTREERQLLAEESRTSKVSGLRVQTRRMAREGIEPLGGTEEEPIIIDDSDGQDAVFTRGEDTDFDDGNESDWSNWSDISFGNATGKKSQQNDHHWTKPCRN
ncbi:hypothetical protein B0H65DRAFT_430234 [Neurospora tetraspora]|uniref:DUF2293 domain-containing protein n=1 Tax=Neurospora tetraspora TaxID=94610 RepID=A0AAE0JAE0_9PEZI|nr:hypothetical protein B0H65DRAFT_430234 [Neurospora tetraspora]